MWFGREFLTPDGKSVSWCSTQRQVRQVTLTGFLLHPVARQGTIHDTYWAHGSIVITYWLVYWLPYYRLIRESQIIFATPPMVLLKTNAEIVCFGISILNSDSQNFFPSNSACIYQEFISSVYDWVISEPVMYVEFTWWID